MSRWHRDNPELAFPDGGCAEDDEPRCPQSNGSRHAFIGEDKLCLYCKKPEAEAFKSAAE